MIKAKSNTTRAVERERVWREIQKAGRLKIHVNDGRLEAVNIPKGAVCHVRLNDEPILGELAAVRYADGSFDVAFIGEGNTRRFCLISADGQRRQVTSRECRIVGRVNFAQVPEPALRRGAPLGC